MADANGQVLPYGNAVFEGQPAFAAGGYRITGMTGTRSSNGLAGQRAGNVAWLRRRRALRVNVRAGAQRPRRRDDRDARRGPLLAQGSDGGIFTFR